MVGMDLRRLGAVAVHRLAPATRVMVHEYAHLLAPNSRHGAAWQDAITDLGYPSEADRIGTL